MKHKKNNLQLYEYEQKFWSENLSICGIDEVGRGCLAGPVVTAAVILQPESYHPLLKDSKLLTQKSMQVVYDWLLGHSIFNVAISGSRIVDKKNIYQATALTMKQALLHLLSKTEQPSLILIDAMFLHMANTPYKDIEQRSLIKGELKSASIAAASIIAKVTRDTILRRMHKSFPGYNLQQHKGYGTAEHRNMLNVHKQSIIHRSTFLKNIALWEKDTYEQATIFTQ